MVTTPLVWLFVHQLGVLYAHSDLSSDRVCAAAVTVLGLVLIVLAVVFGPYDASMVATRGGSSNLLPTTAAIAFTAVFQLGLLGLVAPGLRRLAARHCGLRSSPAQGQVESARQAIHLGAGRHRHQRRGDLGDTEHHRRENLAGRAPAGQ